MLNASKNVRHVAKDTFGRLNAHLTYPAAEGLISSSPNYPQLKPSFDMKYRQAVCILNSSHHKRRKTTFEVSTAHLESRWHIQDPPDSAVNSVVRRSTVDTSAKLEEADPALLGKTGNSEKAAKQGNSKQNTKPKKIVLYNKNCNHALIYPKLKAEAGTTTKLTFPKVCHKHLSKPLFNIPGYFNQNGNFVEQSISRLAERVHFPAELVTLLRNPASLHRQAMHLPCIISRLNCLTFVQQLQEKIVKEAKVGSVGVIWPSLDCPCFFNLNKETCQKMELVLSQKEKDDSARLSIFDDSSDAVFRSGQSSWMLLDVLATKHYCDTLDPERLVTIGNVFLKYAVSLNLFCKHPFDDEGKLTILKHKQLSNTNLLELCLRKEIPSILCNKEMSPSENWLPTGYKLPSSIEETQMDLTMTDIRKFSSEELCSRLTDLRDPIQKQLRENEHSTAASNLNLAWVLHTHSGILNKSIVHCLEGLIGAHVVKSGVMGGLHFLDWLGLEMFPEGKKPETLESCFTVPTQFVRDSPKAERLKKEYFSGLENLENSINYRFNNRMYLLEALWHPSCSKKPITGCNQRLEFLGDAVLDYVIKRYLYEDSKNYNQCELNAIRLALVNNEYFARLAVKFNFHRHIQFFAPTLINEIVRFVKKVDGEGMKFFQEVSVREKNDGAALELEVPKVLGDMMESVAGAIYLDSGLNLKTVWKVFYGMMREDIEAARESVPTNPIKTLLETFPGKVIFQEHEEMPNKSMKIAVDVDEGRYRFVGFAAKKRTAKLAAAKIALYKLHKMTKDTE